MTEQAVNQIQKIWFGNVEEALEAVQAASVLGFGVAMRNEYTVDADDPELGSERWVVDVFSEVPNADLIDEDAEDDTAEEDAA